MIIKEKDEPKQSVENTERDQQANIINEHVTSEYCHDAKGPLQILAPLFINNIRHSLVYWTM